MVRKGLSMKLLSWMSSLFETKCCIKRKKNRKTRNVLTEDEKQTVRDEIANGMTRKRVGELLNISQSYICNIMKG